MLQTFQYQNSPITFSKDGQVMVNATQMAKPFGKLPAHFMSNQQTKDFITALETRYRFSDTGQNGNSHYGISHNGVVQVINGGNNSGTWMHQKLALKFAGWLSPDFELWVYDRIEELLTTGKTELAQMNPAEMKLQVFKMLEQEAQSLKEQLALAENTIKEQAPMVVHYTKVLSAENSHLATAMAQVFGLGAPTFNRLLKEWGIQRRVGAEWVLVAKYLCPEKPLTMTRPVPYLNTAGVQQTKNELRWTEAGREFLVKEFEKRGYKAVA